MKFKQFGSREKPAILLIHGLFLTWEVFKPVVDTLQDRFRIILPMLDGHIYDNGVSEKSVFSTIDDAADQIESYLASEGISQLAFAYGISLGGTVVTRFAEKSHIPIEHLIIDAGPILTYSQGATWFCAYYQALNGWCTYHCAKAYKMLFHSHYFQFAIDEVRKSFPSGGTRTPINVYFSMFAYRLEHLDSVAHVQYWYGCKESFVFLRCARHIAAVRPDVNIRIFPRMQHGQVVIDHPEFIINEINNL